MPTALFEHHKPSFRPENWGSVWNGANLSERRSGILPLSPGKSKRQDAASTSQTALKLAAFGSVHILAILLRRPAIMASCLTKEMQGNARWHLFNNAMSPSKAASATWILSFMATSGVRHRGRHRRRPCSGSLRPAFAAAPLSPGRRRLTAPGHSQCRRR